MSHPPAPLFSDHARHIAAIVRAVLEASDPEAAMRRCAPVALPDTACSLLAVGKASAAMTRGLLSSHGPGVDRCVVIGPPGTPDSLRSCVPDSALHRVFEADHPLPTPRNVEAALAAEDLARRAGRTSSEPLVVLLSGGASAHLSLPQPGITLEELRDITHALLHAGAGIHELNTVRKHLEALKGGGLARLAAPAPVSVFVLSDVMGDDLSVVASGPLSPDASTFADALAVLDRFNLRRSVPRVTARLDRGAAGGLDETLKPGDPAFNTVTHTVIASNAVARRAAAKQARALGFEVRTIRTALAGEALVAGERFAAQVVRAGGVSGPPVCLIAGGETAVHVLGSGAGGRNQEFTLAAAIRLEGQPRTVVASFATDGVDGPTDAAGAWATGQTCELAATLGRPPRASLEANDSFTFFSVAGSSIRTGPTGTNVNDIALGLVYRT